MFLEDDLNEDTCKVQSGIFGESKKVCHLNKYFDGLKEASREWNKKLNTILIEIGLKRSRVDECIYFNTEKDNMFFVTVYDKDLLIFSNDKKLNEKFKIVEDLCGFESEFKLDGSNLQSKNVCVERQNIRSKVGTKGVVENVCYKKIIQQQRIGLF